MHEKIYSLTLDNILIFILTLTQLLTTNNPKIVIFFRFLIAFREMKPGTNNFSMILMEKFLFLLKYVCWN